MGCFEATDAFTQEPIRKGRRVVMIWLTEEGVEDSRHPHHNFLTTHCDISEFVHAIVKGAYNHYGWVEGFEPEFAKGDTHPQERSVFILEKTWDEILKNTKPVESVGTWRRFRASRCGEEAADFPFEDEFNQVACFASACCYPFLATVGGHGFRQVYDHHKKSLKILGKIRGSCV